MKKLIIVCLALFALTTTAQAGFLFEPYIGYDFSMSGTLKTMPSGPEDKVSFSYYETGGRLGWIFDWFGIGIDSDWKTPKLKFDDLAGSNELDTTMNNFGVFVGLYLGNRAQWMIRGKYYFMSMLKADNGVSGVTAGDEFKGTGYGVDLGYRFLHWLAINVEYTMVTYDDFNGATDVFELETSDLLVSISFPLDFPLKNSRR